LAEIATPDFLAEAAGWGLADFFKFALLWSTTVVAAEMDPARIWSFILPRSRPAALDELAAAGRGRIFGRFWEKSISDFWRRRSRVGSPT